MTPTLLHLPYSPWSERARWALDVRGVDYRSQIYAPLLGEPALRKALGKWKGPVSVPVLLSAEGPVPDSWEIARYAESHGSGLSLFPPSELEQIRQWHQRSERGLAAGRALSLRRVAAADDALLELVPRKLRRLGPIARGIAATGVARTLRKYGANGESQAAHEAAFIAELEALRAGLSSGRGTLLEEFSFADISMAQVLMFVAPPESEHVRIGRATRRVFGDPALAARYADLIAWRDELYRKHRGARR